MAAYKSIIIIIHSFIYADFRLIVHITQGI